MKITSALIPRYVVDYVASRYGKIQPILEMEAQKLAMVKDGKMALTDLDSDRERMRLRLARDAAPPDIALERINGESNFQDVYIIEKIALLSKAVCRILKNGNPHGTGFLVAPNVIITNNHVIASPEEAAEMLAEFDYELDIDQSPVTTSCFKMAPAQFFLTSTLKPDPAVPNSGLDFTLIALEPKGLKGESNANRRPVLLDGNRGKIVKGESCVILQHPNGEPKKIVLKNIAFFFETATRIVYESDTLPGSSGSMVVGLGTCELVALHHSGFPRTNEKNQILTKQGTIADYYTPDKEIDWIGNEGIKISKIVEALAAAQLPAAMQPVQQLLIAKTMQMAVRLQPGALAPAINMPAKIESAAIAQLSNSPVMQTIPATTLVDFLITLTNKLAVIERVNALLSTRYNCPVQLRLSMPAAAEEGKIELFVFSVLFTGDVHEEAGRLAQLPEIYNAEADIPLALNADTSMEPTAKTANESGFLFDDGLGVWDEADFLKDYPNSKYVDKNDLAKCRRWNWQATGFDQLTQQTVVSPVAAGIRVVQFDTGYTDHSKVAAGFDLDEDFNFINNTDDAHDPRTIGIGKQPGHATRTASVIVGAEPVLDAQTDHNGNEGLLNPYGYKLVPFRIAETVVIINRQQQLAAALDRAMAHGFDVITMSMGLPPTIATAKMAKKAYEKGIIWCCAAGNEVQAVVAPAVYPGTIAVAASNPNDAPWKGSSRGDTVDITAPGEDVYVPIWNKSKAEDYAYGNGTSYATPHVAAAAALWLAKYKEHLNNPAYAGWKRVEAFRQALKKTASKDHALPKGFGAGKLDVAALLQEAPRPANELVHAYNDWNENAFFATLQGYAELVKTYWNKLGGLFSKKKKGTAESLIPWESLSVAATEIERSLFHSSFTQFEASDATSASELLSRFNQLNAIIQESRKNN